MNPPFDFHSRRPGVRNILLAALAMGLLCVQTGRAQFSTGETAAPVALPPTERSWPAVEWSLQLPIGESDAMGWPVFRKPKEEWGDDPFVVLDVLRFTEGHHPLGGSQETDPASGWLDQGDDLGLMVAKTLRIRGLDVDNTGVVPVKIPLGNVAFNRAATSLNLQKIEVPKTDDLSRQYQGGVAAPNVVHSVPIGGPAMAGVAFLAVLIALAVGYYDRGRRRRRSRTRRPHHHHRRRRSKRE